MRKLNKFKSWSILAGSLFVLTSVGCGKSTDSGTIGYIPGSVYPGVTCPAGQIGVAGACGSTFEQACSMAGGWISNGVCRAEITRTYAMNGLFGMQVPRLSPTDSSYAYDTGITVTPGDFLQVQASGGWGNQDGLVWTSGECSSVSVSAPNGLMVSEGAGAYLAGSNLSRTVTGSGRLRIGFDAPYASDLCTWATVMVRVVHCQNAAGQTLSCQ